LHENFACPSYCEELLMLLLSYQMWKKAIYMPPVPVVA